MAATIEFGFDAAPVFTGVDRLERRFDTFDKTVTKSGGGMMRSLGGVAYQVQDIAVQLQMGTRYSTVLAQQGSQLLSAFGAGGAIAGGVVAIGGAFLQMADNAKQAFDTAAKAQVAFDAELQKKVAAGSMSDLISFTETATDRAAKLRENFEQIWQKRSAGDVISETFGGPKFADKYLAMQAQMEATEKAIAGQLSAKLTASSDAETQIVLARLAGREKEADAMERELNLSRELARIDSLQVPGAVKDKLKGNAQAKADAGGQAAEEEARKKADEHVAKIAEAQGRLDEQKHKAGLDEMTLARRIATISLDIQKAAVSEGRLRKEALPDEMKLISAETKRVSLQAELGRLQKQYATEKEREVEASKRSAEQAEKEAMASKKSAADRKSSVLDTALEYKLLKAKAGGNERAVEEAERQQRVLDRKRNLEENNGLDPKAATALALKMTDLEDRANGKGSKIHGVQDNSDPNQRTGLSPAWQSGPSGGGTYRGLGMGSDPLSKNGGLAGFWDLQAGNIGGRKGASDYYNQNALSDGDSIQAHHAANAKAKDDTGNTSDNRMVDAFLDKLVSRLPEALASAILEKS